MDRRFFIKASSMAFVEWLLSRDFTIAQRDEFSPVGTANACIFIKLLGAPSHVDTFDVKEGAWTPPEFDVVNCGSFRLSRRLFPNLCQLANHVSLVRSIRSWGVEHNQAVYSLMAGRIFNPGFVQEIPHIGSVVSLEYALRGESGVFPSFISFNGTEIEAGFLASSFGSRHNPFITTPSTPEITHPDGEERFDRRWQLLQAMDAPVRRGTAPQGDLFNIYSGLYSQAKEISHYKPFEQAFSIARTESQRYGSTFFGDACIIARNILAANQGTRFISINHGGENGITWDSHSNIYGADVLPSLTREVDSGLAGLIADMRQMPASPNQEARAPSLLDKTLIVVMGEFGRTPGNLNNDRGRDHYPIFSALFAGGGTRGNVVIGRTDDMGANIVESGWRERTRPTRIDDITATIYSALGINWTTVIRDTPSGRAFGYAAASAEGFPGSLPLFS